MTRLEEIKARVERATPGPWELSYSIILDKEDEDTADRIYSHVGPVHSCDECPIASKADGKFIAAAREDIPYLIAEVERLRSSASGILARRYLEDNPERAVSVQNIKLREAIGEYKKKGWIAKDTLDALDAEYGCREDEA